MNTRIIDAMEYIDDKFIKEALDMSDTGTKSKSRKPLFIGGACTIAAAVIAGVFISRSGIIGQSGEHYTSDTSSPSQTESSDLPASSSGDYHCVPENPPESAPSSTPADNSSTPVHTEPIDPDPEPGGTLERPLPYDEFAIDYDDLPFEYTAPDELPKITADFGGGAMGFEGFTADDVSECVDGANPWNESLEINELPMFRTKYGEHAAMYSAILDKDEAVAKLEEIAAALGGELSDIELYEVNPERYDPAHKDELTGKLHDASAMVGDIRVTVFSLGNVHIEFGASLQLPDGYGFDIENPDPAMQDKTAKYLIDKFPGLFGYTNPVSFVDFTYQTAYDYSDDAFTAMMNYNFKQTSFYYIEGEGVGMWIDDTLADYECSGFYPVITPEEAREKLLAGDYVTTVPKEPYLPGGVTEDRVEYMELVYHLNSDKTAYIPYYRFLVRLESNDYPEDGSNSYGAFYVPAVEPEYLDNTNLDLKFN